MNQTTIADIEDLLKGTPIVNLRAMVKKAFEPGEGESKGKPWKMQGVILQDGDDEIRATFWNRFNMDFRNLEGSDVTVSSVEDKRGKFSGVMVDEYKGKKQLKVSEHAALREVGGEPITEEDVKEAFNATEADEHGVTAVEESGGGVSYSEVLSKPISTLTKRFVSEETKRESIEKQVALKAAVEICAAAGKDESDHIVKVATTFYEFLHGNS